MCLKEPNVSEDREVLSGLRSEGKNSFMWFSGCIYIFYNFIYILGERPNKALDPNPVITHCRLLSIDKHLIRTLRS